MEMKLRIEGLHKWFGTTHALAGLDLNVRAGEVMGFLGPNGSGKSTAIRVVMGLLRADQGTVEVLGQDPWRDAVALHQQMVYVPGDVNLWPSLTGGEIVDLLGTLGPGLDRGRRDEMLERFDLDPTKRARTYSKGNRQKVALVAALASSAEMFIFDEPTSGLDPLMESVFQDVVRELVADGRTVLLSSHILAEVESLCDRVTIIRDGAAVESGSLEDLRHLTHLTMSVRTRDPLPIDALSELSGVAAVEAEGTQQATLSIERERLAAVMEQLAPLGLVDIESRPPTLEELFMRHYATDAS